MKCNKIKAFMRFYFKEHSEQIVNLKRSQEKKHFLKKNKEKIRIKAISRQVKSQQIKKNLY